MNHTVLLRVVWCIGLLLASAGSSGAGQETRKAEADPDKPEIVLQTAHAKPVTWVRFSSDGKRAASCDGESVCVWDVVSGRKCGAIREFGAKARPLLGFTTDGRGLLGSDPGSPSQIGVWDADTCERRGTLPAEPGGPREVLDAGWEWVAVKSGADVEVLSASSGERIALFARPPWWIHALSPDGRTLACATDRGVQVEQDGSRPRLLPPHGGGRLDLLAFSPDGQLLAGLSFNRRVAVVWNVGEEKRLWEKGCDTVTTLAWHPDGSAILCGRGDRDGLTILDARTGASRSFPGTGICMALAFSRDGRLAATGHADGSVIFWDAQTWQKARIFPGTSETLASAYGEFISPAAGFVGWLLRQGDYAERIPVRSRPGGLEDVASGRGLLVINDTLSGERVRVVPDLVLKERSKWPPSLGCTLSTDGRLVAVRQSSGWTLSEVATGAVRFAIAGDAIGVQISSDSGTLAAFGAGVIGTAGERARGANGATLVYDIASSAARLAVPGHYGAMSGDGKRLFLSSKFAGQLLQFGRYSFPSTEMPWRLWDITSDESVQMPLGVFPFQGFEKENAAPTPAFSPSGDLLAYMPAPTTLALVDLKTGVTRTVPTAGRGPRFTDWHYGKPVPFYPPPASLAFGADGRYLRMDWKEQSALYELAQGAFVETDVTEALLARSGFAMQHTRERRGSRVEIRDPGSGEVCATFVLIPGTFEHLVYTPQGYYAGSPGTERLISWRIGDRYFPFDHFEERFHRPDLVMKALTGGRVPQMLAPAQTPPEAEFVSPEYGVEVTARRVEVAIRAGGVNPVRRIDLTINGNPAPPEVAAALTATPTPPAGIYRAVVPLPPGDPLVRLRAVAYDQALARSRPAELLIKRPGAEGQPGTLYVLAVGVNNYRNENVTKLQYAVPDASALCELLKAQERSGLYTRVVTQVLADRDASLTNLKFVLRSLKDSATELDTVVVFVAGHGGMDGGGNFVFGTSDVDPGKLGQTALGWQDFVNALRDLRARRVLVLADTCHSGGIVGQEARLGTLLATRLNREAHRLVFAASRRDEVSVGRREWGHGAFTYALLEALSGRADANRDRKVTFREMGDYVTARVADLTGNRQHPQMPFLDNYEPDGVLAQVR